MRCLAAVVLLLFLLAPTVSAQPAEPGGYSIRASLGFATQDLGDVNDDIVDDAAMWRPLSSSLDWDDQFGEATPFGLEFGYQYSERWSWAFGFTWHKSTVEHSAQLDYVDPESFTTVTGEVTSDYRLKLLDLYATAMFWVPRASGLHIGAQLGFALGGLDFKETYDLTGSDGSFLDLEGDGEGHASGLSAGAYAGYELALTPHWTISARGGYLYCNLGEMDGRIHLHGADNTGPIDQTLAGHMSNNAGEPMDFDFSGVRVSGAVTYRFRWSGEF